MHLKPKNLAVQTLLVSCYATIIIQETYSAAASCSIVKLFLTFLVEKHTITILVLDLITVVAER